MVPLERMPHGAVGHTFTLLKRPEGSMALGKLVNILRFKVKEIDPSTGARPWPQSCTARCLLVAWCLQCMDASQPGQPPGLPLSHSREKLLEKDTMW